MDAPQTTDFRPDEGGVMPPDQRAFMAQQAFSDPAFLSKAAEIALRNRQPQGLAFLERAASVAKENAFEAVGHLLRGDGESAIAAFNKSGRFTDATGAKQNGDGTWTITRKSGAAVTVNPEKDLESYLDPRAYFAMQEAKKRSDQAETDKVEERALRSRQLDILDRYYQGQVGARQTTADAAATRAGAAADLADARIAGGAGGVGGASGARGGGAKPHDIQKDRAELRKSLIAQGLRGPELDAEVERSMRSDYTSIRPDPDSGYLLVDDQTGRVIGNYDTYGDAQKAHSDWINGKGLPAKAKPKDAAAPPPPAAAPAAAPEKPTRRLPGGAYGFPEVDASGLYGRVARSFARGGGEPAPAAPPAAKEPTVAQKSLAEVQAEIRRLSSKPKRTPQEEANLQALFQAQGAMTRMAEAPQ